eukprot:4600810-Pyramimonas_sp.AAC.1
MSEVYNPMYPTASCLKFQGALNDTNADLQLGPGAEAADRADLAGRDPGDGGGPQERGGEQLDADGAAHPRQLVLPAPHHVVHRGDGTPRGGQGAGHRRRGLVVRAPRPRALHTPPQTLNRRPRLRSARGRNPKPEGDGARA